MLEIRSRRVRVRARPTLIAFLAMLLCAPAAPALAWGDEGHEVVALVARHYLRPAVLARVEAMLATDGDNTLTAHDMASEATWADKLRDANVGGARLDTRQWHFADIELADGDEDRACFGHPAMPAGGSAYPGVAQDCVVDKVGQFQAELADPHVDAAERLTALKFLLHFVGDLHQPLHSSDDGDRGGNDKRISDVDTGSRNLHAYWDTAAVRRLGVDASAISAALVAAITPGEQAAWASGTVASWALEAFQLSKADAYGRLPPPDASGKYELTAAYDDIAGKDASLQLSRAGVRLAEVLNEALGSSP